LDEYRKHIEKDPALERRFEPVKVPEPTVDETVQILRGLRERYELYHKLRYTDDVGRIYHLEPTTICPFLCHF
jgi:ATP-dependent Clp protease ATP-binding subunit ClpC